MNYYTTTTEYNCGIDLHARQMYMCLMDRQGNKLVHTNIQGNDFAYFLTKVAPFKHDLTVVSECTFNWYWLADACEAAGIKFVLAHALYAAHIHGGKNKNDRIDSEKLAHLLRTNLIPPAYLYPAERRPIRALLRQRMSYVWHRAELMTHLSMNQTAQGFVPVLKGGHNRDVWQERILAQYTNPYHQLAARCDLDAIRVYDELIEKLDGTITFHARQYQSRDYNLLLSVPGIGPVLAMTILYEIDTITRFPTVKDFSSYCRLVKGSVASAGRIKGLTGGKMGNAYLRWAFGEAAVLCKRSHRLVSPYADRLVAKHGTFKGNAILAHQIARAVYYMLQSGQVFDAERLVAA
ncbi:MAG: IS110 family transposase [bacterium]|jgi:transposase